MTLKYKLILFIIFIALYLCFISFFWPNIQVPLKINSGAIGLLTIKNINPINDTIRFIFLIFPPLILYLLFLKINFKTDFIKIKSLSYSEKYLKNNLELRDL